MADLPEGRLDVAVLDTLAQRATSHPLVVEWAYVPDARSPRLLAVELDAAAYPSIVTVVRLNVRWFDDGDYAVEAAEDAQDKAIHTLNR